MDWFAEGKIRGAEQGCMLSGGKRMETPIFGLPSGSTALFAPALPFLWAMRPDRVDVWFAATMGRFMERWQLFGVGIQSAIVHDMLGGFWFALAVFIYWTGAGAPASTDRVRRIATILIGSLFSVVLALLCGRLFGWLPPNQNPALAHYFPGYILANVNQNSFPSASTALYAAVAAGLFSISRPIGAALWALVLLAVGLPRMFVGGHYASDVVAGALVGLIGYLAARSWIEPWLSRAEANLSAGFRRRRWLRVAAEIVVFVWIFQLAVEFREVVWVTHILEFFLGRSASP
jgi:undecaprenyl-diphosphatase